MLKLQWPLLVTRIDLVAQSAAFRSNLTPEAWRGSRNFNATELQPSLATGRHIPGLKGVAITSSDD